MSTEPVLVLKRIRRPNGETSEQIERVDDPELAKVFRELGIEPKFEIKCVEPEFQKHALKPIKITTHAIELPELATSKPRLVLVKLLEFRQVFDFKQLKLKKIAPRLIPIALEFERVKLKPSYYRPKLKQELEFRVVELVRARFWFSMAVKLDSIPTQGLELKPMLIGSKPILEFPELGRVTVKVSDKLEEALLLDTAGKYDLLKLIFGKTLDQLGLAPRLVGEPILILIPNSGRDYHYLLLELCKEIYRQAKGRLPKPYIIYKSKDHKPEDQLRLFWELGERIDSKILFFEPGTAEKLIYEHRHLIRELFSQGLGFIVINSDDPKRFCNELLKAAQPYQPKILLGEPMQDYAYLSSFLRAVREFWGLFESRWLILHPSHVFGELERRYKDAIQELLSMDKYACFVKKSSTQETEDHIALKVLAIKHLVEHEGISLNQIETEAQLGGIQPDVYAPGIAIEIETLYGVGPLPLAKIRDTILKYAETQLNQLWIVLRNFPAQLYAAKLLRLKKILPETIRPKIKFMVPDLDKLKLISLDEILRRLTRPWHGLETIDSCYLK